MSLILTEIKNKVGFITLNSEATLNSLNLEMIEALTATMASWKNSSEVACIFIQGAGEKALCAGGDVRQLYDNIIAQRTVDAAKVPQGCFDFFSKEYALNYEIHTYPKPIIVWGHGIVMGGGIGVMVGASHRIVTERSKLAMPEITIGLFPDVGATWFLNRMPSAYGIYLGLTGARLDAADCRFLGLADYYMESTAKQAVVDALVQANWSTDIGNQIDGILADLAKNYTIGISQAEVHQSFITQFEAVETVDEFRSILVNCPEKDSWIETGMQSFSKGSPSSAHIIFKQLQNGKEYSLEQVFQTELNLACQCCIHPDFAEGVRALLVDKDQSPKWQPATLEEVTSDWVESYFKPLWTKENDVLKNLGKN
ncbi:enoyl-CoA hydratase/isomerase family protein [Myroides sp. 1354]|uniref:enoyl-CoA hydratase/isomerase family protein n=1 Tax=unclassified Myroides TaxID=2642485 RepID=UPI002575C689|nr:MULTISPECIES: enoyl-CoA hydratase/isomerase family protein [unclassified Myroides]MDM1044618.1 enoyl-CoA hydratase/isomerase family protein [Myroides sp. R163-1]MDM1055331.1 enoyl-CoA hydratase/isomerase family protein [Myroides sp. 1354]MDM1068628.1 enoyl-CoA hydratase/isomerase family protein [Myroides sp. 1372]